MSIQLTYSFATQQDLLAHLQLFGAQVPNGAPAPAPAPGPNTAKAAAPKKTAAESTPAAQSAQAPSQASTAATASQETASEGNAAAAPSAPEAPAAQPASSVEYPVLQKAVFALAGKSREAAAAVAASFGVKTFKELPQDKWTAALAAVQAKTAEL